MPSAPDMSVAICSRNGAPTIARALESLFGQTIAPRLEIMVVDDGSTDETADIASRHGATVVQHETNRGLAAARNSAVRASRAPIIAFIDDDCEADPDWAERLLAAYDDEPDGVGGVVHPGPGDHFVLAYLRRHNPLQPLELELMRSEGMIYRLRLYLTHQWTRVDRPARRAVFSLVGANMSFRRESLDEFGLFDEHFSFGGEETELCYRMRQSREDVRLVLASDARVTHHFSPSMRDTLRRSRAYGLGGARLSRRWRSVRPTIYPVPVLVAAAATSRRPSRLLLAAALPAILYPSGLAAALRARRIDLLADAYIQLLQEASSSIGMILGLWRFRRLGTEGQRSAEAVGEGPAAVAGAELPMVASIAAGAARAITPKPGLTLTDSAAASASVDRPPTEGPAVAGRPANLQAPAGTTDDTDLGTAPNPVP